MRSWYLRFIVRQHGCDCEQPMLWWCIVAECSGVMDLVFVLHSGDTMLSRRWHYMVDFVEWIVERLDVAADRTRVAVVYWSDSAYVGFTLDRYFVRQVRSVDANTRVGCVQRLCFYFDQISSSVFLTSFIFSSVACFPVASAWCRRLESIRPAGSTVVRISASFGRLYRRVFAFSPPNSRGTRVLQKALIDLDFLDFFGILVMHRVPKKLVHQAHIDNLVNSQRILIIPSLAHSLENLR